MKIVKTASGKTTIKMSKAEWQSIGKKAGWTKEEGEHKTVEELYPMKSVNREPDIKEIFLDRTGFSIRLTWTDCQRGESCCEEDGDKWKAHLEEILGGKLFCTDCQSAHKEFSRDDSITRIFFGDYEAEYAGRSPKIAIKDLLSKKSILENEGFVFKNHR